MLTKIQTLNAVHTPEDADYQELYQQMTNHCKILLSQVSHEIRNPVTFINSFLQLLETRHPELSEDDYWKKIMENMGFLITLLNELSDFNNSENLTLQASNLYLLFCEVVESAAPVLKKNNISITLRKKSPIPVIQADCVKIRQLLFNLIRNAGDAVKSGGEIVCSIQSDTETITLTVSDNGNGIPKEYQKNLFEPFVTHKKDGTGLGLPICKRIAAAHNGSIHFTTSPEESTTFFVILPVS